MQRHDDTQGEDSSGADIQVQVSPTLCSSQIASQNQITYPCDPLKSSTSTSTSPTNDSIDGSGPATPIWFSNTPEGIHGTLPGGRLGSLSPVLPACPGSHPTTSFVSGSGMSDSSSSHQRQSPSQTISQGYSPHLAEVDRQTEKLSEASGEHEEQVGEHCTARHQHEQSYDEASEREQPAGVYTFHMSSSSAEYAFDDMSVEAGGVADSARGSCADQPRQHRPHQLENPSWGKDGTWTLDQSKQRGTARLHREISELTAQVNMLVGMVREAKDLEADLEQAQQRCIAEVAAVKESIRSEAEACSNAVDKVLQARQGNVSPGYDPSGPDANNQGSPPRAQSSHSLSHGNADCSLEPRCSPSCSADRVPSQVDRSGQDTASLCSRIAVLEAELAAQRPTAETASRSNSNLAGRLSDLLGSVTGAHTGGLSSELPSPPRRTSLLSNDSHSRAQGSVGAVDPDHRLHGDTSRANFNLAPALSPATACDSSWNTGSPGQKQIRSTLPHTRAGQVQALQSLIRDHRGRCTGPGQHCTGVVTPPLQYAAALLRDDAGGSDSARVVGQEMMPSNPRRVVTAPPARLGGWRSPSFRHGSKLPPALEGLPLHMHRYAPPSILAELAPVASPLSEAAHAQHTCQGTGSHLVQRLDAPERVGGHTHMEGGFVRSPFGSIMGSSAQHAQASI